MGYSFFYCMDPIAALQDDNATLDLTGSFALLRMTFEEAVWGGRGGDISSWILSGRCPSRMTMNSIAALQNDSFSLREFSFFFGDSFSLDGFALNGFFLFFEGCTLDGATHHTRFALEACALCRRVHDTCGIVACHALDGIGFLSVCRVHCFIPLCYC